MGLLPITILQIWWLLYPLRYLLNKGYDDVAFLTTNIASEYKLWLLDIKINMGSLPIPIL